MNNNSFSFLCRTKTCFGKHALDHLPFDLSGMGAQKPFVIQDKISQKSKCTTPLIGAFKNSDMPLGIYPGIEPEDSIDKNQIKEIYQVFVENGFDSIIALGGKSVSDIAKVLNLAVSSGPGILQQSGKQLSGNSSINSSLMPFVYLPTSPGTGKETDCTAQLEGHRYDRPDLAPDIALIDPQLLTGHKLNMTIDSALVSMAVCSETFVLSKNPPAQAYAESGLRMIRHHLFPLLKTSGFPETSEIPKTKAAFEHLSRIVHASVISGYLMANHRPMTCFNIGHALTEKTAVKPGNAMMMVLPAILNENGKSNIEKGQLLRPLVGEESFAAMPENQQADSAIQNLQSILNSLYQVSRGRIFRTLPDSGLKKDIINQLTDNVSGTLVEPSFNKETLTAILTKAFGDQD